MWNLWKRIVAWHTFLEVVIVLVFLLGCLVIVIWDVVP